MLVLALVVLMAVANTGCGKIQENYKYEYSNPGGQLGISAWEFLQRDDSSSLMKEAVTLAGLQQFYAGTDEYTFIIPRNSAFRLLMKTAKYESISGIPVDSLQNMLKYHLVKAKVLFSDPALLAPNNPIAYDTENGQVMYLSHNTSYQGLINQGTKKVWTIITSNLEPTNGVIHITSEIVSLKQ